MQLCDMVALLYNKSVRSLGCSNAAISTLESLAWGHAIAEEFYGLEICTEVLEHSIHLNEDVTCHSSPNDCSCERSIRVHKQPMHNAKGIEKTLAERENIRFFLCRQEFGRLSKYSDGKKLYSVDLNNVQSAIFFHEQSFEAAKALLSDCKESTCTNQHLHHTFQNGFLLGKLRKKAIQDHQQRDIKMHLGNIQLFLTLLNVLGMW